MANPKKGGLGKGLHALISDVVPEEPPSAGAADHGDQVLHLDPQAIEHNPKQPRTVFHEEGLEELAASIRRDGVQAPVLVRKVGDTYQLVSGERRVRAAIMAGLTTIPALCRDVPDEALLKLGLIENIQREDLNPIELARAYQALMQECNYTQEQLADEVGKNRATVANTLRLLNLPAEVQRHVSEGAISMGHARALLALESPAAQSSACRKIIRQGLSVRQVEALAAQRARPQPKAPHKDPNLAAIEDELRRRFMTRVSVHATGKNRGKIEIEYYNLDDLERMLALLRGGR